MFKIAPMLLALAAAVALEPSLARGRHQLTPTLAPKSAALVDRTTSTGSVLVTINGFPIGEADIRIALKGGGHDKEIPSKHRKNVLEVIVRQELIRQRAVALGLNENGRYQEKLCRMEAQINAFKRKELSELFWREMSQRAETSETEAKKYFTENAVRIRSELHVWQLLSRDRGSIERAQSDLQHGASFENVAKKRFPKLPITGRPPWDLGYLRWKQVPESWRSVVYALKKGEVSGVIQGPNNRFWIVKLIDKFENPDITFESIKPIIVEVLKNEKLEQLRQKTDRNLRENASIVYSHGPVAAYDE